MMVHRIFPLIAFSVILAPVVHADSWTNGDDSWKTSSPMMIPPEAYRVLVDPMGGFPVKAENFFDYFDVTIGAGIPRGSSRMVRYAVVLR